MARLIVRRQQRQAQYYTENLGDGIELDMILIPGGSFLMGTEEEEMARLCKEYKEDYFKQESPQHQVNVPSFYMGRYPITQAQWKAVAELDPVEKELDADPSNFKDDYETINRWKRPVERVSWEDAQEFCARLSKLTGKKYRLPTEAEWEYACRAGTTTPFHFGETITTDLANYRGTDDESMGWKGSYGDGPTGEYRKQTTPVGYFRVANNFGLYDMHGNVWEWCEDDWHRNYEDAPTDGSARVSKEKNEYKIIRGGSWYFPPRFCRSASRFYGSRVSDNYGIGLRVVSEAPRTQ